MSQPHAKRALDVASTFDSNLDDGLTEREAAERLNRYGKNSLVQEYEIRFIDIFKEEITEPMILLLLAIGVVYSVLGLLTGDGLIDAATIIVIIVILVLAEVWNEYRAKRSVNALRKLAPPTATVRRNGLQAEVQTANLVPGDILLLKVGQRVPADARILEAYSLEVDESSLTGESLPVTKDASAVLPPQTRVIDQINMVFTGTVVTRGRAKAIVTQTGVATELGRIQGITKAGKEPKTQLQLAMKQLSKTLVWVALFFAILIPILSYIRGLQPNPGEAVLYGLSLAFVVIPEELPIIITMVLGVGSYALSRRGAIVKRLRASETLGNVTVIATDKTGTITENKPKIEHIYFDGSIYASDEFKENEIAALRTAFLASDAADTSGNPFSAAILERLRHAGVNAQSASEGWVLKSELGFDVNRKLASYIYQFGASTVMLISGAPERLLERSNRIFLGGQETPLTDELQAQVLAATAQLAHAGERLLAFGYHRLSEETSKNGENDVVIVGVIGFIDPPRKEAKNAIHTCQRAGIRIIMVTGDHPETAKIIASQVGIDSNIVLTGTEIATMTDYALKDALRATSVFARVTPEDKLRIVKLLREMGEIVAVTGDGINDAPALKDAHIGIAMGKQSTDVAKEAAGIIITDNNFATIANAVSEGRRLYSNLRKGVRYYLACKVALVSIFLIPIILGIPLPFAPIQIVVLELFMDLAASATFVAEPQEKGAMKKPPTNPKEPFMSSKMLYPLFMGALSLFAAVTMTYLFTYYSATSALSPNATTYAQTMAFSTWMFGHIFLAFNMRSENEPLIKQGVLSNKVMLLWALVVVVFLVIGTSVLQVPLQITALQPADWAMVVGVSFAATFWMELKKMRTRQYN
jgi:Ca2+-transporting ATPase